MPVTLENKTLPSESLGCPLPTPTPPDEILPYTEAKLDPIYAPCLGSGPEAPRPSRG